MRVRMASHEYLHKAPLTVSFLHRQHRLEMHQYIQTPSPTSYLHRFLLFPCAQVPLYPSIPHPHHHHSLYFFASPGAHGAEQRSTSRTLAYQASGTYLGIGDRALLDGMGLHWMSEYDMITMKGLHIFIMAWLGFLGKRREEGCSRY